MIRGDCDQRQICIRGDVDLRKQKVHASDELLGKSQLLPLIKLPVLSLKVQQKRSKTGCNIFVTCVFAIWLLMIGSSLQLRMHYTTNTEWLLLRQSTKEVLKSQQPKAISMCVSDNLFTTRSLAGGNLQHHKQ